MFPDLRVEEQGRIVEPALGRAAPVSGFGDLALAPLSVRGQAVESVVDGTSLGRCPPACGCGVAGRGLLTAIGRVALAHCLAGIALGVTGHDLLLAIGLDGSVRYPLLVGEVAMTAHGHAIPLATGHGCGCIRTVRSQRIKAGEPYVSNGRVWRQ